MLDLFAGLGGASRAFKARGWEVVTVDNNPAFGCSITADLLTWRPPGSLFGVDFLWASPPCDEFARESMPWCRTGRPPSLGLVQRVFELVRELAPRWWVLENVRGAQRWIGRAPLHFGPVYLWGYFPRKIRDVGHNFAWKERLSSAQEARRAEIPLPISEAFAEAVERDLPAGVARG